MNPAAVSGAGSDSGTNGDQLPTSMWETPNRMTAAITSSLTATMTWLSRLENLMPAISTPVTSSAISTAGRSIVPSAADPICAGTSNGPPSTTSWK